MRCTTSAPQDFSHIAASRPLPQTDGVRFLWGCETDLRHDLTLGIPPSRYGEFDFIVIPTTHMHMTGFTITEENAASSEARARLWAERLDTLLSMRLPFHKIGLAHLACPLLNPSSHEDYIKTLDMIPSDEMHRLFKKAAVLGVGIELNAFDMKFSDDEAESVLRMFRIAKEEGCKFYLGSDAHHPAGLDNARKKFERAIDDLELTEEDKMIIK